MKCPPKLGQSHDHEGTLPAGNWHLPTISTGLIHEPLQRWPSIPSERSSGWRSAKRISVLQEDWQIRPSDSRVFSGKDVYKPRFFQLLIPRKTLKSLMVTSVWAIQEKITIRSREGSTVAQTSKVILRDTMDVIWHSSLHCWELQFYELHQTWGHQPFSRQHQLAAGGWASHFQSLI